jgi:hypothetical protein
MKQDAPKPNAQPPKPNNDAKNQKSQNKQGKSEKQAQSKGRAESSRRDRKGTRQANNNEPPVPSHDAVASQRGQIDAKKKGTEISQGSPSSSSQQVQL